jgi:hypothetical protein
MRVAVIAEADLRERMRCVRAIAAPGSLSAVGAGSWEELTQILDQMHAQLIVYAPPLPGEPEDALAWLARRAERVILASADPPEGAELHAERMHRPISDESLALLARSVGAATARKMSFAPADFLQMVCMSDTSCVIVVSDADADADAGVIEVRGGRVWTAFDALGVGEEAFARLVRPEMRARVSANAAELPRERTIWKDLAELLIDSLRRFDEGAVVRPPPLRAGQLDAAIASREEISARVKDLTARARKELMERRYEEAARSLAHLAEIDPKEALVRANLEQLRKLGYAR